MSIIVSNNAVKRGLKLVHLLHPDMKVLLEFGHIDHGMGDCVMMWSVYQELKKQYPDVVFNLHCRPGQELFNDITTDNYDLIFQVPFIERGHYKSKPCICAEDELGIKWRPELEFSYKLPEVPSSGIPVPENAVGMTFQCVSDPRKRLPAEKAQLLWNCVKECGFNPIEVHFEHRYRKPENTRYSFTDLTCRDFTPSVENCIDVIRHCKAFIGINTGTFCMAVSMYPEKVLHLGICDTWSPKYQTVSKVSELNCAGDIDTQALRKFLEKCK